MKSLNLQNIVSQNNDNMVSSYLGIFICMLLNGSYVYWGYAPALLILALLYTVFIIIKEKLLNISQFVKSYAFYYLLMVLLVMLIWGVDDMTYLSYIIVPLFSYFFCKHISYENFRKKWLNITFAVSLWSLFAFLLFQLDFAPKEVLFGSAKAYLLLGVNIRIDENRLCGLFFEPGVYQISIIFTLLMWIREIREWCLNGFTKIQIAICVLALICTQSTMGYISLIVLMGSIVASSRFVKVHLAKTIIFLVILTPISIFLFQSSIIQNKLNEEDGNMSYTVRVMDSMAAYSLIEDSPIWGNGIGNGWTRKMDRYGNVTNSNGLLNMISRLGVPWLFFYMFFLIRFAKRNKIDIIPLYFVFSVLLPLCNEDVVFAPLGFLFALDYK